jgi:chromosomal replication initiator protein
MGRSRKTAAPRPDAARSRAAPPPTAEEFFHTVDAACSAGTQVVISADRPPAKLPMLEARLRERLEGGLLIDLSPPDLTTRLTITRRIAASNAALEGADDVLVYVARRVTTNVRVLQGALIRLSAYASLTSTPVTLPLAERVLNDLYEEADGARARAGATPTVESIKSETARALEMDQADLTSARRGRRLVYARQIAMYLSRELTDLSLPAIAQHFGGRDHTTVLHAHRKIKNMLITDQATRTTVSNLSAILKTTPQRNAQHVHSTESSQLGSHPHEQE